MSRPIAHVSWLTRKILADEVEEIRDLLRVGNKEAAEHRLLELRLAIETKPFEIDVQ